VKAEGKQKMFFPELLVTLALFLFSSTALHSSLEQSFPLSLLLTDHLLFCLLTASNSFPSSRYLSIIL
jgi:hypothetical protein